MSSSKTNTEVTAAIGKYITATGCLILGGVIFAPLLLGIAGVAIGGVCLLVGGGLALIGKGMCFYAAKKGFAKAFSEEFSTPPSSSPSDDSSVSNKKRNEPLQKMGVGNWNTIGEKDEYQQAPAATTPTFVASTTKSLVLFSCPKLFTLRLSSFFSFWKSKDSYTRLEEQETNQVGKTFHS